MWDNARGKWPAGICDTHSERRETLVDLEERRSQDGFVNVNLPIELDQCVDGLISKRLGTLVFSKKKVVWQAAVRHWLNMRPDRNVGTAYLPTQATKSKLGRTGFVQRRVELGTDLEASIRQLAIELADRKGRPFPLARIIYTALDHYVRHLTLLELASVTTTPSSLSSGDGSLTRSTEDAITIQINATESDIAHIVRFVHKMADGPVHSTLTLKMEKDVARRLLTRMLGDHGVNDDYILSMLAKQLAAAV